MESAVEGSLSPQKGKKRPLKVKECQKNVRKAKRNSGLPYTTVENQDFPGRPEPVEATCKCKFSCRCLTLQCRQLMFRQFWALNSYNEQQEFLRGLIRPTLIKRRRHGSYAEPCQSRRQHSFKYFLALHNKSEVQVCKKTFCETFGIAQKRVQLLGEKIANGNMDVRDGRGGSRPKESTLWKQKIQEYISTLPVRDSDDNRSRKCLSPDLNVSKLHRSFVDTYTVDGVKPPVSRQWFNDIFLKDFKLSFGNPRVDTCSECDRAKIAIDSATTEELKSQEITKLAFHHRHAEKALMQMAEDVACSRGAASDTQTISFDLQQQMYLPCLTRSEMYHCRQLACINLGVRFEDEDRGVMFCWDETAGSKGPVEIASCLYSFLTIEGLGLTKKRKLVLWSDNSRGHTKNEVMMAMSLTLVAKGYFAEITHKFIVRGHTFLSCDRDFDLVDRARRGRSPVVPRDVIEIIADADGEHPFVVIDTSEFFDWMDVAQRFMDTSRLQLSKGKMVRISEADFGTLEMNKGYKSLSTWRKVGVLKEDVSAATFRNLDVKMKETPRPMSEETKKDMVEILPYLPPEKKAFYERLLAMQ